MLLYLCPLSAVCEPVSVSVPFILDQDFLSCRRSNTRFWSNAGLMLVHRLRCWANISPVSGYNNVLCLVPSWTLASITDGGPAVTQLWFKSSWRYRKHADTASMKYWLGLNGYWPAPATLTQHLTDIGWRFVLAASSKQTSVLLNAASANTKHWNSANLMLGQHRRWWASIGPTLAKYLVFARSHIMFRTWSGSKTEWILLNT